MQALPTYDACMQKMTTFQYTIRQVPGDTDAALRKRGVREGKSLNAVVLDALRSASGAGGDVVRSHDLDALAGTWVADKAFDKAIKAFKAIDQDLWS
jgi:hypothetical protein